MPSIHVATSDGLRVLDDDGTARPVQLAGRPVTALGRARSELWAVVDRAEVWHAAGEAWSRVANLEGHRATCIAGIGTDVFVGASEARLFRAAGDALEAVEAFDRAEGRPSWYTPWGGPPATRSIANWDEDTYVNVHVGGILRTDDGGRSWTPTIDIDADVHHVTTAEGLVLAACARGLAASRDRGATWGFRTDGLQRPYSRAVAVCGDVVLVSASDGPRGGHAGVYRSGVRGGAFERCRAGLPDAFEDNIDTYCLDALPDGRFAAFGSSGRLFGSTDAGSTWEELTATLPTVHRVLVMP